MKLGPERIPTQFRLVCGHVHHLIFLLSTHYSPWAQMVAVSFPQKGQIAETGGEGGQRGDGRGGGTAPQFCCRLGGGHWGATAIFQDSCSFLQGYPERALARKRRNKSESSSLSVSQLSRLGLCEAWPQVQSYSNSRMNFDLIKGIKMSAPIKASCHVDPEWPTM